MNVSERRLHGVLRALGCPIVAQARIGPYTVDFLLPDLRVVIESDSRCYHARPERLRSDRARDADLQGQGFAVIHVWSDDLYRPGGAGKILDHVRLRVLRTRGVRLGGRGAERQFARMVRVR